MAFVIAKRPTASFPVKHTVYNKDGKAVNIEFVAQYHRSKHSEVVDLQDSLVNHVRKGQGLDPLKRPDGTTPPEWQFDSDVDFVRTKMCGWIDVKDEDGQAVPFTEEGLVATIEDYPELVGPLLNGFFEAHRGARQKN